MAIDYPMINGRRYSWASVVINFNAAQYLGVKSININEKVDPQKIHGTGQNIIGTTAGMYDADGDVELYQAEADALVADLGTGWANKVVTIQVQYIDDFQPTTTIKCAVRLVGRTQGGSEGGDALTSKFTMFFVDTVETNGTRMVPPINAAALGGPVLP